MGSFVPAAPPLQYFHDYELLEEIGRGGMGVVFKARQISLNRLVALKLISAGTLATEESVRRFKAEAEAAASLSHPNIIPIFEIGEHDGQHYFSMGLVPGRNLGEFLSSESLGARAAAELIRTLALAVSHAHQHGVLHRDIKPSNILVDQRGEPYLTDFGLAKFVQKNSELTQSNAILGTPSYMSPEQARGDNKRVTTAADVYGIGAVLYTCLTGHSPFAGETLVETLRGVLEEEPPRPSAANAAVDHDLETICLKCLEKDPALRYPSTLAVAEDLGRWLRSETITARPSTSMERVRKWVRRRPAVAALGALTVSLSAFLLSGLVFYAVNERARSLRLSEAVARGYFQRGHGLCESGDLVRGLHWLVRSLKDTPDHSKGLAADIRQSLGSWSRRLKAPDAMLPIQGQIVASALSPDGAVAATADSRGLIQFWRSDTGELTGTSFVEPGATFLVFSSDRKGLAVLGKDFARIWSIDTAQPLTRALPHPEVARALFTPDGARLITYDTDLNVRTVLVWDVESGEPVGQPLRHANSHARIWSAAISPDGSHIATACGDKAAYLWETETGLLVRGEMIHENEVMTVKFSPDGRLLLTASQDFTARLWDLHTGTAVGQTMNHAREVWNAAFDGSGKWIVTGSMDGTARVWDGRNGRLVATLDLGATANQVRFSPDGRWIVAAAANGKLRIWSAEEAPQLVQESDLGQTISDLETSGGTLMIRCGSTIAFWSLQPSPHRSGTALNRKLGYGEFSPETLAFAPDGARVLGGDHVGSNWWWTVQTGELAPAPFFHGKREGAVVFSPDGKYLLTVGSGMARLWSTQSGLEVKEFADGHTHGSFSGDSRILALSGGKTVRRWSLESRDWLGAPLEFPKTVSAVSFASKNDWLLIGCSDGSARVFSIGSRSQIGKTLQHGAAIRAVAFSPDTKLIVTGGVDKIAKLWDSRSFLPTGILLEHSGSVADVLFVSDGMLATAGSEPDDSVRLWNPRSGEVLAPRLHTCCGLLDIDISPDHKRISAAGHNAMPTVWEIDAPFRGSVEDAQTLVSVLTAKEMDRDGILRPIAAATWREKRRIVQSGPDSAIGP
jgi:eukaryotic-like serine/threonine-protein kinase